MDGQLLWHSRFSCRWGYLHPPWNTSLSPGTSASHLAPCQHAHKAADDGPRAGLALPPVGTCR